MTASGSQAMLEWLAVHRGEMLAVLEEAVNLDSEWADLESFVPRAQALALTILELRNS
jgi:hypothetical protein